MIDCGADRAGQLNKLKPVRSLITHAIPIMLTVCGMALLVPFLRLPKIGL